MFFGEKLKQARKELGEYGPRNFAAKMGMSPSDYVNIEHGYMSYPTDFRWFDRLCYNLGLFNEDDFLKDLGKELLLEWRKPFIMQKMHEDCVCSPLVHKTDGTPLTEEEFRNLHEHINNYAKEHNKKADEYNNGK